MSPCTFVLCSDGRPFISRLQKAVCSRSHCISASYLTWRWTWDWDYAQGSERGEGSEHPLMHLVLGKQDIQEQSKADWLSKTFAVLQGIWFVLNVISRHATGLYVTLIEIATVAFAMMAVLIYLANWWKPKDVAEPTMLPSTRFRFESEIEFQLHDRRQSFRERLLRPEAQATELSSARVPNDVVWLEGNPPLLLFLMGRFSLIFGGLHCLAWNSQFPTQVELFCWRIASLASAVLPVVALAITAIPG